VNEIKELQEKANADHAAAENATPAGVTYTETDVAEIQAAAKEAIQKVKEKAAKKQEEMKRVIETQLEEGKNAEE